MLNIVYVFNSEVVIKRSIVLGSKINFSLLNLTAISHTLNKHKEAEMESQEQRIAKQISRELAEYKQWIAIQKEMN